MEGIRFFNILRKHRYTLVIVPVLVMITAFFLTRKLPDVFVSKASLAAGIVKASSQTSILDGTPLQDSKINQEFGNMIQLMQMKKTYDQVSYMLMLHDLKDKTPFRKPSKLMGYLNDDARRHAIAVYSDLYTKRQPLSLWDADQKGLNDLIVSMGYDYEALSKKMKVYRIENSDFITVEYESESPVLSAFVVNTLCTEFIAYHNFISKETEVNTVNLLNELMTKKRDSLGSGLDSLRNFKINNHLLNLKEQAGALTSQIAEFETKIQMAQKDVDAANTALDKLNAKFTSEDKGVADEKLATINKTVLSITDQINRSQEDLIRTNDRRYQFRIDSLKSVRDRMIYTSGENFTANPATAKENLVNQRITLELNRDLAQGSIASMQRELTKLKKRFDTLVPKEAIINSYEGNINLASQEYVEIQKKYNQAQMAFNTGKEVKQIEVAMPGAKQPSKKMLLVLVAGIGSFVICLLVLFVLFYLDNSIQFVTELANKTNLRVLGTLPFIQHSSLLNLNQLWATDNNSLTDKIFRDQLRSVRYETELCMEGHHLLAVTSLADGEGKTFMAMCLASAYTMVNKKVLLIDGNFTDNRISQLTNPQYFIEDFLNNKANIPYPTQHTDITIIGNKGMDISLFEINTEQVIVQKLQQLKDAFDIIIVEASSLNTMNKAKEWITVSDKVTAPFEANKTIKGNEKPLVGYLQSLNSKFIGWVMNKQSDKSHADSTKRSFLSRKTEAK